MLFAGRSGWPSIDVEETEKEYRVTAELPGLEERDVEVLLEDGLLSVRGEKKLVSENRSRTYSERFYGRFERQITLDRDIDENAVNATFKNGVLTVIVPEELERRRTLEANSHQRWQNGGKVALSGRWRGAAGRPAVPRTGRVTA